MFPRPGVFAILAVLTLLVVPQAALAQGSDGKKPNILVIMGDDVGWFNLSIHNHGIMGYRTPNLDKIGREGAMFTDAYAEQSCTAGRASFITGQHGLRTGMTKVGLPGVPFGLSHEDPTLAEMLKPYGYATGQFGKNHLGDTNDTLPTTHGFDEFFGNLYHLNAEQEPEHPDYPTNPEFKKKFGPRGVIHSFAATNRPPTDSAIWAEEGPALTEDDPYGDINGQTIFDTGPLTIQRMKTIDGVATREAIRFMAEAKAKNKPFFTWWNSTRMHVWTHLKEEKGYDNLSKEVPAVDRKCYPAGQYTTNELCNLGLASGYFAEGKTGLGIYPDGMIEHDMYVGALLDFLKEKDLERNTIVIYTTDNGAETFTWPDGGSTPFRSEKATNWEGAYRVPMLIRWPGVLEGGIVSNTMISLLDFAPTLVAVASEGHGQRIDIKAELAKLDVSGNPVGYQINGKTYKVHLDGYDFLDYFRCINGPRKRMACLEPRDKFIYANDDGIVTGIRIGQWKAHFYEQRAEGGFSVWEEPFTRLRVAKLVNVRTDPFEKADHEASDYDLYRFDRAFALTPLQVETFKFLQTFKNFPPRQAPPSFSIDEDVREIIEKCGTPGRPPKEPGKCYELPGGSDNKSIPLPGGGG
jgi:arylsulfatase A-like enzyme